MPGDPMAEAVARLAKRPAGGWQASLGAAPDPSGARKLLEWLTGYPADPMADPSVLDIAAAAVPGVPILKGARKLRTLGRADEIPGLAALEQQLGGATMEQIPLGRVAQGGSGESAASLEAIGRQQGMKGRGESFAVIDRTGRKRPLIGPEAVDYRVRPGELFGIDGPSGFRVLDRK